MSKPESKEELTQLHLLAGVDLGVVSIILRSMNNLWRVAKKLRSKKQKEGNNTWNKKRKQLVSHTVRVFVARAFDFSRGTRLLGSFLDYLYVATVFRSPFFFISVSRGSRFLGGFPVTRFFQSRRLF